MASIPEIQKFRQKYPDYGDMDDSTLATKLAQKYPDAYADLPKRVAASTSKPSIIQRAKGWVKDAAEGMMAESDMAAEASKVTLSSVGRGVMKGYAKTADTALGLVDAFRDKDAGESPARKLQRRVTEPAIKYWTKQNPSTAEQVGEGLGEIGSAVTFGPGAIPAMAGNATYQTGKELIEGGATVSQAQKAGAIQGAAMGAMGAIPAAGKTIPKTVGLATANPAIGAASRAATQKVLEDNPELAKQFDPLNPVALGMDVASAGLAIPAHLKLKAQAAKGTRPTHENLGEGVTAKDSLSVPSEVKPVVKGTPEEMLTLDNEGALEGKVLHQKGDAVYAIDPKAVDVEQAKAAIEQGGDAESAVLGYPPRDAVPVEQRTDAAVTKQGEVVTDLPTMKAETEAGNVAWAAEGEKGAVEAKAQEVAGAVKGDTPVPLEQPPVLPETPVAGEAPMKESTLAARAESDAIAAKLTEDFGALPEYRTMSMKDQADRATAIMDADYEAAKRMAMGDELPPSGVREATMYEAVKIRAIKEGDVETLHALATESKVPGKLSEYGQAVKAADSRIMDDPVKAMQDVGETRAERAKKTGTKPADAAKITELERQLTEVTTRLAAVEEIAAKKKAAETVKKIKKEIAETTTRRERRSTTRQALDTEFKDLSARLKKILNPNKLNAGIDPTAIPVLYEMAKNRVKAGINSIEGIVESIYREVKDVIDVTRREIRDALSGYGKTSSMSKDEINVQLRELKRQARLISALEDAQAGALPKRSGLQRDPVSNRVRELQKEVKQAMRESGIDSKASLSPEERFKTSLDAVKTRLKNQIHDLEKQLATGEKTPKRQGIEYDAEAKALAAQRDQLKAAIEAIEGKRGMSDAQKIANAINSVKKTIADLTRRIKEHDASPAQRGSKTPETPELKALREQRDKLRAEFEANKKLYEDMKKQNVPDEDPMVAQQRQFMVETERRIKAAEKALQKSIAEHKRRISEGDLAPKKQVSATPETPVIAKLKAERAKLAETLKQLRQDAKAPKDPEAVRLKSFKTRVEREIAKFEKALTEGDFAAKEQRKPLELDSEGQKLRVERDRLKEDYRNATSALKSVTKAEAAEIMRLSKAVSDARTAMENGGNRLNYGAARVAYENYINDLKGANLPIKTLVENRAKQFRETWKENPSRAVFEMGRDTLSTITNNSIAMVASLDNSFLGRQGLKTLMTHPSAWLPGARKSFVDFAKTLGGKNARDALLADIYSRPNYINGEYERAGIIAKTEEQYPANLPERIPVIGRVFKASEVAFTGSGLRMRTDLYDLLSTKAKENGVNLADKANAESLGKLINSLTARGQWGKRGEGAVVRLVLWAPKMLKANIDVLTMHNFGSGLELPFARKQAAMNLVKIAAETAAVMAIANALKPGSAETDPRSSDFGKIKIGDTRFDITGGAATIVTLASRILTRSHKSSQTGLTQKYGFGYGEKSPFDALIDFLTNKTSPPMSVLVSWLKGKDRTGERFTWKKAAYNAATPISVQNAIKLKDEVSADRIAGVILDSVGISANSYDDSGNKRYDIIERIREGKPLTEKQKALYDGMTERQRDNINNEAKLSAMANAFQKMSKKEAAYAFEELSDEDKAALQGIYNKKFGF